MIFVVLYAGAVEFKSNNQDVIEVQSFSFYLRALTKRFLGIALKLVVFLYRVAHFQRLMNWTN